MSRKKETKPKIIVFGVPLGSDRMREIWNEFVKESNEEIKNEQKNKTRNRI